MSHSADWIITDANIWCGGPPTSRGSEPPSPTALALRDGLIQAVGSESEVLGLRGPDTAVFSLNGRFLMPGFVDAHLHLLTGGLRRFHVNLKGVASRQEFMQRVSDRTRSTPKGSWILGGDWNQEDWGGDFPTREWLDRVTPEHPIFLARMDLHLGLANSTALRLAGIDAHTPDPENGHIDRNPDTNEPTGILRERAMLFMYDLIPDLTDQDCAAALRGGMLEALTHGVTQVHDMGAVQKLSESWQSLRVLRDLEAQGRLPIRVGSALPLAHWRDAAELIAQKGSGSHRLQWGRVKGFVDGSFGSSTAWFHEPYLHEPSSRGGPVCDLETLRSDILDSVGAGLQPTVHAIGDAANDWLLEVCRQMQTLHPGKGDDLRVEHAQHLTPAALEELGATGRIVSMQPSHLQDDAPWLEARLGLERMRRTYAFRSLEARGARLALGSDWPVAPIDPLVTVWNAVNRCPPDTGHGLGEPWCPQERMELDAVLRAHTWGGAVAGGTAGHTGSLHPGKAGDFVVLSEDPFRLPAEELHRGIMVDMTFVDGILLHQRDGSGE
ncbi:MAG: amidohydrolase [Gemmatimonadota bacterium]